MAAPSGSNCAGRTSELPCVKLAGSSVTEIEERGGEAAAGQAAEQDVELAIARGLLERAERGVSLVGPEALLAGVTRSVSQAALDAETTDYLGLCERPATCTCGRESPERDVRQDRADRGRPDPAFIPRDRRGEFQPQIIPKHARRFEGAARPSGRSRPRAHNRGDPRAPDRDLRSRRLPGPEQQCHRRVTEELAALPPAGRQP